MAREKSKDWIVSFQVKLDESASKTLAQDKLHVAISQFIAAAGRPGLVKDFTVRMRPKKRQKAS